MLGDLKLFVHSSRGNPGKRIHIEGFDPGSERTLAAWIRHASRMNPCSNTGGNGERGSNAWVTYPGVVDSRPNGRVIHGDSASRHRFAGKDSASGAAHVVLASW